MWKKETPSNGVNVKTYYYLRFCFELIRDAQGNTMATYTKKFSISKDTSLLEDVTDPSTGSYSLCNLLALLPNCGTGVGNTWFNFVKDYIDTTLIHTIIKNESNQSYLISILLNKTGSEGVVNTNKDAIALALNNSNSISLTDYLIKINKYLGSWVYQSIIETVGSNIVIKKEITLDELHIYGSSRHGIHKPNLTLVNKTYRINKLDSATDSSQAFLSYSYFKRTLTYKQYELSNHLGNVLATVLDRKTAVTDSTGGDTLMYYVADVYTAGLYYAFGSAIIEMQYKSDTGGGYRYGFNGEELMNELSGDGMAYDLGERFYDGRLGKMFSLDPLSAQYPWQSPYAYCYNNPIWIIDVKGMGGDDPPPPTNKGDKVKKGEGLASYMQRNGLNYYNQNDRDLIAKLNPDVFPNGVQKGQYMLHEGMELIIKEPKIINSNQGENNNSNSNLKPKLLDLSKPSYYDDIIETLSWINSNVPHDEYWQPISNFVNYEKLKTSKYFEKSNTQVSNNYLSTSKDPSKPLIIIEDIGTKVGLGILLNVHSPIIPELNNGTVTYKGSGDPSNHIGYMYIFIPTLNEVGNIRNLGILIRYDISNKKQYEEFKRVYKLLGGIKINAKYKYIVK